MARSFAWLSAFLLLPSAVGAAQKVVLFPIVPITGEVESGPAREMTGAIVEELKLGEDFEVAVGELPAAAAEPSSTRRPARNDAEYRAALADLDEGAKQAQKLRFPQAIQALRKGIDRLVVNLDLLDDYNRLVEAHLLLAVAYFRRGKEAAGTDVLEQVARLRPDLELDPAQYPPLFRTIFDKARDRALGRTRGKLRITSAPSGADVLLNGRSMGRTPLLISSIVPGANDVVVRLGQSAWAQRLEVSEGGTEERHADLGAGGPDGPPSMGEAMAANRFDREVRKTARQLARNANGDWVIVLAMARSQGVYAVGGFLGNARTGKWTALDPIAPDLDMLSASIEAHSLSRDVREHIKNFTPDLGDDDFPFVAGKAVQVARKSGGARESTVEFVGEAFGRSSGRGPVLATGEARGAVEVPGRGSRRPVGASGEGARLAMESSDAPSPAPSARTPVAPPPPPPVAPAPKPVAVKADPKSEEDELPLVAPGELQRSELGRKSDSSRKPLSRTSGGRGPVVSRDSGIEIVDDAPEETRAAPVAVDIVPKEAIIAASVDNGATGPLAVELHSGPSDGSIFKEWWFWTAVGGGVAAASFVTWFFVGRDTQADTVRVHAVW